MKPFLHFWSLCIRPFHLVPSRFLPRPTRTRIPVLEVLENRCLLSATLQLTGAQSIVGGQNINVSNEPTSAQSEMSVDINPADPLNVVGFSHDFGSGFNEIDVFYSTDGGAHWQTNTIDEVDDGQGTATSRRFDPSIAFASNGDLYIAYGVDLGTQTKLIVARSQDGGASFNRFTAVDTQNKVDSAQGVDKWLLATGPDPSSAGGQAVYVAYNQVVAETSGTDQRVVIVGSNDGWATFTLPVTINDASIGTSNTDLRNNFPDPAVGPDGELYVSWVDYDSGLTTGSILLDRDLDGLFVATSAFGTDITVRTLVAPIFQRSVPAQPQRGIYNGPVLDADRSGGAFNGQLYITFVDDCTACNGDNYDVFLAHSSDRGATWSNLGTNVGNLESADSTDFLPWVDVDQKTGSVNVLYYTTDGDQTRDEENGISPIKLARCLG